jgi:5-oxoprolinase (ATP-hydrolysing)
MDVIQLELFTNRFRAIAEEMGEMLRRTAISTNVKERLDFSCGLLDADGELVVNAPHMPVHLGALGLCVRSLLREVKMRAGDVVVTNHPAYGGSHLPDITVVTPVVWGGKPIGYVANRAHHAEIGGAQPGSMPPFATCLAQEGVVIPPFFLLKKGKADWRRIRKILTESQYPSRALEDNIADLKAAVAANHQGTIALKKLLNEHGATVVTHYMAELKKLAELRIRSALRSLPDGKYQAAEHLDDGSPLKVAIEVKDDTAIVDFSGSAGVHPGNLNATPAIVRSVVIYILRLLIEHPLPLNEGLMAPVTVIIPEGMLNPHFPDDPEKAPAVVGGNVETSQRLVNAFLKALRLSAGSQGTMNNTLFGNARFGYYETVCGGTGAGPSFDGCSAVHSHMTNTRITDPEIIELRYPVRVEQFAIRPNSGGAGKFRGGDGAIRELTFLEEISLSIVSQHRTEGPFGLNGGEKGKPGSQTVIRSNGELERLKSVDGTIMKPGDRLVLETPGGGGYGNAGS